MNFLTTTIFITQQYFVPFVMAIGVINLIHGVTFYVLGSVDETDREQGRIYFIKALVWILGGLIFYGLVAVLALFFNWVLPYLQPLTV